MRKDFGPQTWVYPMPVLIIGTYDENNEPNAMNAAWGGTYDYNQIMICLSSHQTTDNIRLKYEKAKHVDAPIFTDYPLTLECEVVDIINEGEDGGNIIAKIVNVSADESVLDANGKVDTKKINFVSFDPITSEYRKIGETVALAFREGMKLK